VKNDPDDIEIKDELMELPLDVTLVSDGDSHVDTKVNSTDDDRSIPGECKKIIPYINRLRVVPSLLVKYLIGDIV